MDRFDVGRDCNCPNSHREHILIYKGKKYVMHPKINGSPNSEYRFVKRIYTLNSYKINEYLEEMKNTCTTWREV